MARSAAHAPLRPIHALVHPLWWGSLALLALNDHVLKPGALLPGVLTGKLSDFAGLVVAPALFAVLLRVRSRRGLILSHVAVGAVFAALQLSRPFADLWSGMMGLVGAPWVVVCDPTDLVALPMLVLAYRALLPVMGESAPRGWLRQGSQRVLLAVGMLFCIATSKEQDAPPQLDDDGHECIDADYDGVCRELDCDDSDASIQTNCCVDGDGDGICQPFDCDDTDPTIDHVCPQACDGVEAVTEGVVLGDLFAADDLTTTGCELSAGPERIYAFTVPGEPQDLVLVTASVAADVPLNLAARDLCEAPSEDPTADVEIDCRVGEPLEILTTGGSSLYLVVEAPDVASAVPFELSLAQAPIVCGDGVVVGFEECDDGNTEPGDGCDADCRVEVMP
ncbi:MAG: myxococcus cysteine-rich repeat containing protein [Polyangiaceae bacterium]